jgi:protein SCO1/2
VALHGVFNLSLVLVLLQCLACESEHVFRGSVVGLPTTAPAIDGTNWDGKPFSMDAMKGQVAIVFFGYASCPDVCPFTLARLRELRKRLGAAGGDLAVILVSVDPERDDISTLAEYVPRFDPSFFGVRIEPARLEAVTKGWFVGYRKQPPVSPGDYYTVDHTGTLFVVDRSGQLRVRIPQDAKLPDILPDVEYLLGLGRAS